MNRVTAKIGLMNIPSIQLFTKVGFSEVCAVDLFGVFIIYKSNQYLHCYTFAMFSLHYLKTCT